MITGFNIAAVERDTGLSKAVLRMWERRYGFPEPQRDANGDRCYPAEQVDRLRLIKRLMDQGHRPGKLLSTPVAALGSLAPRRALHRGAGLGEATNDDMRDLLELLRQHDAAAFQQAMQQRLARQGLQGFVHETVAPLSCRVGEAWEDGYFDVAEEHLFTELTKRVLRQAIATLPGGSRSPRILLTTVSNEPHGLGLLMAETLFALEGAECLPMGTQMPVPEIGRAALIYRADIVALSFSAAFPQRQIPRLMHQLRNTLPPSIALWAGGSGVARVAKIEGVAFLVALDESTKLLRNWRGARTIP